MKYIPRNGRFTKEEVEASVKKLRDAGVQHIGGVYLDDLVVNAKFAGKSSRGDMAAALLIFSEGSASTAEQLDRLKRRVDQLIARLRRIGKEDISTDPEICEDPLLLLEQWKGMRAAIRFALEAFE